MPKHVHIALGLFILAGMAAAAAEPSRIYPNEPRVVIRGEAFPRKVQTPVGIAREDELDPATGIPVSYERAEAVQAPGESAIAPSLRTQLPLPRAADDIAALRQAIDNLQLAAALQRNDAETTLRAYGDAGLAALVQWGLYNDLPSIRARSANLLGTWGGARVLKFLMEAFYSAAWPTIPPYQVQYVDALAKQISRITGRNFRFSADSSAMAPVVANRMMQWWAENYRDLPQQLGEPELDPKSPQYEADLKQARSLHLLKRDFPGSNLPPEIAGPPVPNTPAEQEFLDTIPTLPRGALGNRNISPSLEPAVPKAPSPARDAPGRFREQLFERDVRRHFGS